MPAIWKYGDVELHFDRAGGRLWLIHLEAFDVPSGGRTIALEAGELRGGEPRDAIERWLDSVEIAHRPESGPDDDAARILTLFSRCAAAGSGIHASRPAKRRGPRRRGVR